MKKLACLHAHYSNIDYLEEALSKYPISLQHFVDPGLMLRLTHDDTFTPQKAREKVRKQLEWIASCGVEAIVITCTNYIAMLDDTFKLDIPIIKIDEPFFKVFSQLALPKTLVFTNPATVSGTTERLNTYLDQSNRPMEYNIEIIHGAFDLVMSGQIDEHDVVVSKALRELSDKKIPSIAVAQLSMVKASESVQATILNPLLPLIQEIEKLLNLQSERVYANGN